MGSPAVGIDLGTTFSAIAAINPAGKPEIVANAAGERITASAILFQADGKVLVGSDAADQAAAFPGRTVRWVKRQMGKTDWSFSIDGRSLGAVDLSAMILAKVKKDAEQSLGPIRQAVVSVPAYFDEVRRKATMDAASAAGLEVLRIINEPTAAALAYAATGRLQGNVLVYDFGGGTFDVSIVHVSSPTEAEVLVSEGDHDLGGFNLDKAVAIHFAERFRAEHGVNPLQDAAGQHLAMAEAETAKKKLSTLAEWPSARLNSGGLSSTLPLDRATFEGLIRDSVVRTEMLVEDALDQAELQPSQIEAVLLVGGTTRIPAIREMLTAKFGKEPLQAINPDEAVALGAAIQAGALMHSLGKLDVAPAASTALARTRLQDVTNHSYGTIAVGEAFGSQRLRNTIIIPKNEKIPCSRVEDYYTVGEGQQEVRCQVTQGEDEDPEFVNVIMEGVLELPPGRPPGAHIQVTYSYDANQRMTCEFRDVATGRTRTFNLDGLGGKIAGVVHEMNESDFDELVL